MAHRNVDIKHACGHVEKNHPVELGAHVRHDSDVSVNDHLRVKPCAKCQVRGGWSWTETHTVAVAKPKPETLKAKPDAKPKP